MSITPDELEKNKQLGRMQREVAIATKKIMMDEMSHASRWIMASVLAINSGGLIACLGKIDRLSDTIVGAAIAFYVGVALAMIMGWRLITINQTALPIHSRLIAAWEMTAIDGVIEEEKIKTAVDEQMSLVTSVGVFPSTLGKISFLSFSIGLVFLALSPDFQQQSNVKLEASMPHDR
jgi:hypothetical protein